MSIQPHKGLVFLLAAAVLFILLAAARYVFVPSERGWSSVQGAYDSLAAELDRQKLLPLHSEAEVRAALSGLATPQYLPSSRANADRVSTLGLGQAISCEIVEGQAAALEIDPRAWRELKPGPLRDVLRELSLIPLERQAGKNTGVMALPTVPSYFSFTSIVGVETYIMTPTFDQQKHLTGISVRMPQ